MVDAVVSFAVQKLGDFLIQQAVFLRGIEGQVQWLQRELRLLRSYLKDAERKQSSDERIRMWISEIQDIAFDTEDVIETFIFKVNNKQIHSSTWRRMGSSVRSNFCCIYKNAKLYGVGKDIEDLKNRVLEISRQRETYGINNLGTTQNNGASGGGGLRITTSYGDEDLDDVVGLEDDFRYLQAKLFDGTRTHSVVSILGMGGLGKTTLARKLYNKNKIMFSLHAWIYVSQEWKAKDLLEKLIKSFVELDKEELDKKVDKMKLFELESYLRNLLEKRQYLVVIDDLWHREAWESIKKAFPENKKGSRMIITTRKEDVAALSGHETHVHKLRFLRFEESWSLFCKKAFPDKNGVCPDDLETLGKEMTEKCGGLPLAIVVLGGLLSKREFHEWEAVKEHIWREVKEDSINDISRLLDLSYNDLSNDLKPCFLYLCIFPEDALISVKKLLKLWMAEELIPINEEGRTLEEVSECYFKELLGRNLVQTAKRNWRMTSSCRVHDLLRDLALKKARETNFLRVCNQIESSSSLSTTSCRRFAIHSRFAREELLNHSHQKVRTLYFLNDKSSIHYSEYKKINVSKVWSFRWLRVLLLERVDLRGERKSRFFGGVAEMIHLRYFGLENTDVDEFPNSIGNLKALQTLNIKSIRSVNPVELPKDICKLKELRHLAGDFSEDDIPKIAVLSNLQTLKVLNIPRTDKAADIYSKFFVSLNNLRKLRMRLWMPDGIPMEPLFNCKELVELKITGRGTIREVPKDIHKYLTKLEYLRLHLSYESKEDPIPKLELLPNLLALHLFYHPQKTISWTFSANGFPRLEFFKLPFAYNIELLMEEGAMPRLRFLCVDNTELKKARSRLPERFRCLPGENDMNWKFCNK